MESDLACRPPAALAKDKAPNPCKRARLSMKEKIDGMIGFGGFISEKLYFQSMIGLFNLAR